MNHSTPSNNINNKYNGIANRRIVSANSTETNDTDPNTNDHSSLSVSIPSHRMMSATSHRSHQRRDGSSPPQAIQEVQSADIQRYDSDSRGDSSSVHVTVGSTANSTVQLNTPTIVVSEVRTDTDGLKSVLYRYYPRQFEEFTQAEVITSITNYVTRHLHSFLPLKSSSSQIPPESSEPTAMFYSVSEVPISMQWYITRLVTFSKVARVHFIMMLVYVDRIAKKSVALIPSPRNVHRLLATALATAVELTSEDVEGNDGGGNNELDKEHASRVSGIPSTRELILLMKTFADVVDRDFTISKEDIDAVYAQLFMMKNSTEGAIEEDNMSEMTTMMQT